MRGPWRRETEYEFGREEGKKEGIEEGKKETREEFRLLMQELLARGRGEEFARAVAEEAYLEQLLEEFGLGNRLRD